MSSYIFKLIMIFIIAAVGAGIHLGASWPVKLKAEPRQPPPLTLSIPNRAEPSPATEPAEQPAEKPAELPAELPATDPQADANAEPGTGVITLDGLEIDLATARALHENQLATFIDARPAAEFEAGHIAGAMHIAPSMLENNSTLFVLDVIDPSKPIVIYCGGGDCDDSNRVAEMLQDLRGLTQTHVFVEGYPAWADAGLPTSTGPDPWAE